MGEAVAAQGPLRSSLPSPVCAKLEVAVDAVDVAPLLCVWPLPVVQHAPAHAVVARLVPVKQHASEYVLTYACRGRERKAQHPGGCTSSGEDAGDMEECARVRKVLKAACKPA